MATYLVTGGCGFIGSHLCDALLARGDAVRVLDDLSTGSLANLPAAAKLIEGDIADRGAVRRALDGVDGCFHLAAIASVERGQREWVGSHRTNLTGTITLLDEIRHIAEPGQVPFVYASSAAVYGDCKDLPIAEDSPARPLSAYGADKYGCELHARVAWLTHGIPATGLRFFNVYGPRQDASSPYSGVISIFAERLRRGAAVRIFGDGRQTRDFVFVDDVVSALLRAMELRKPGAPVFNVCSGVPASVLDLARTLAELCATALEVDFAPARTGDIRESVGAPARARAELGLQPALALRSGLARLLQSTGQAPPAAERRVSELQAGE